MDINEVKELLTQFDQSTLTEFDLKKGSFGLYMNKNNVVRKTVATDTLETAAIAEPIIVETPVAKTEVKQSEAAIVKDTGNTEAVVSPIVGIVYLKPAPDKENFKQVGDLVKKGEVICIVEAMKLMNEITATADGTITEILVNNEDVVEFNQPLFTISKGV